MLCSINTYFARCSPAMQFEAVRLHFVNDLSATLNVEQCHCTFNMHVCNCIGIDHFIRTRSLHVLTKISKLKFCLTFGNSSII